MTERTAYKLSEVREALGISRSTMWRWVNDGKIPVTKICGRPFVRRDDFEKLMVLAEPTSVPTFQRGTD